MPGWDIHLEAGERLANKMKLVGRNRRVFLLGCILPDINNGYINDVKTVKDHNITHYAFGEKSSLNFYEENKRKIRARDPIFLGYLLHLYTDGYFNYDFYRTIKEHELGLGKTREEKRKIKQHDFWIYDMNFNHHLEIGPDELGYLVDQANRISVTEIEPEDILNVEKILEDDTFSEAMKGKEYQFYTKARLDKLLDNMLSSFSKEYLERKNA